MLAGMYNLLTHPLIMFLRRGPENILFILDIEQYTDEGLLKIP